MQGKNWCLDDEPTNCELYGRLYTWSAAIDSLSVYSNSGRKCGILKKCELTETIQGICPNGWHVPSIAEFKELLIAVGMTLDWVQDSINFESSDGAILKSQTGWPDYEGASGNGTDDYGFATIPYWGGRGKSGNGKFVASLDYANFWTSFDYDYAVWFDAVKRVGVNQWFGYEGGYDVLGFPVRCVKNGSN
jgi:uncharacterized protein (TIGR02145 family)